MFLEKKSIFHNFLQILNTFDTNRIRSHIFNINTLMPENKTRINKCCSFTDTCLRLFEIADLLFILRQVLWNEARDKQAKIKSPILNLHIAKWHCICA